MIEVGGDVGRFHRVRRGADDPPRVAFGDGGVVGRVVRIREHLEGARDDALVAHVAVAARIPFLRHELKGGEGPVVGVRDDRDPAENTVRTVDDLVEAVADLADPALAETIGGDHAGTVLDRVEVEADEPPARHRRCLHRRVDHVRQPHVDPVDGAAVGLDRGVQAGNRLPEEGELVGRLDGGLGLEIDGRGRRRELAVGARVVAGAEDAVGRGHRGPLDPPGIRRSLLEALAGARSRLVEVEPRTADGPRAAGRHALVELVGLLGRAGRDHVRLDRVPHVPVDVRVDRPDLGPVALELFGDEHGHGGEDALSHLRLADPDGHRVVGIDDEPGVHLLAPFARHPGLVHDRVGPRAGRNAKCEHQSARGARARDDELASIQFHRVHRLHPYAISAARWIALRIRA